MTIHRGKQNVGLGLRESGQPLLPFHEARQLPGIPRPLGLVEHHNMVHRRRRAAERVVAEVVDVLNKGFDRRAAFADARSAGKSAGRLVCGGS